MIILSHPTCNEFARAATYGLKRANSISGLYTAFACFPESMLYKLGNLSFLKDLKRRSIDISMKPITYTHPFFEIGRMLALKANLSMLTTHEKGIFCVDSVYSNFDKYVASQLKKHPGLKGIYAYEDGALQSFIEAKKNGIGCLYDLPIGYWRTAREILEPEKEKWPEWAQTLTGFKDSPAKLERKDKELALADKIFVASKFTAESLSSYPGTLAEIKIIPYAFPTVNFNRTYRTKFKNEVLNILYVGSLSQRKGIAYLFTAVNKFKNYINLTIVGTKVTNDCPALDKELSKHRWIPSLPHYKILELMTENDVLIFPSLFEGFGLVITEAMSQGTPVITTDRTAGPDLIENDKNGWIIDAGSTDALVAAIEKLLYKPDHIAEAGKAAKETAKRRTWDIYGNELAECIEKATI